MGRLTEALEPMHTVIEPCVRLGQYDRAAVGTSNLSELELTLGVVAGAVGDAEQSVTYADRSGDAFERMSDRTTHADALHQAGRRAEAETRFREAEQMQAEDQPDYPLLYSARGFKYCDLLLTAPEGAAWRAVLLLPVIPAKAWIQGGTADLDSRFRGSDDRQMTSAFVESCRAVSGLRRAGTQDHIPRGLLTRAWLRFLTGACTGPESAQADLDEAWEIAERGPMRLHMADILLARCRLFGSPKSEARSPTYPWKSPQDDLAAARKLIEQCGYGRRVEELTDAEAAIGRP